MRFASRVLLVSLILAAQIYPSGSAMADHHEGVTMADPITYPETRRGDVVEDHFGTAVADPYRWLENDVREDEQVRDWVAAENAVTDAYLATLPGRAAIEARLTELWNYERLGIPIAAGGHYFYAQNDGLQNQSVLMVRDGLDGTPRLLLDPNDWSDDDATALAEWEPSPDGSRVAYAVQDGGTDWRILHIIDVATGAPLDDEIRWAKFTGITWAHNGAGFFYSRFPEPQGAEFTGLTADHSVYFHSIGTPQSADRLVYATSDRPALNHSVEVTDDGRYLVIFSSEGTDDRYEVTLIDLTVPQMTRRTIIRGMEHNWELVGSAGDIFYFVTNMDAPRERIVRMDVATASRGIAEVVAEDAATLESANLIGDRIVATYLADAKNEVRVFETDGSRAATVDLPGIGSVAGFEGEAGDPETFFAFTSYATPTAVYRYDSASGETSPFFQPEVGFDPDAYLVEQLFYSSLDGTRIPMFLVRRADLDMAGPHPTLLYGYGGFNISMTPGFSPAVLDWMEMGGVYAVANLRGGGEYGAEWHNAGRLHYKQNGFDDFIAAGEYLIAQGITTSAQLAIRGGSNGGLLVGAVTNQRPDLFAVALPAVGVMDMLRFNLFTAGRYWVDDYGHPDRDEDFRTLLAYSPYHNVHDGLDYPAMLVTTADTDDRVVPGHSFKYIAAIQHAAIGDRPHLIRIETRAGHGSGRPTSQLIAEYADLWAFAARWTGLAVPVGE